MTHRQIQLAIGYAGALLFPAIALLNAIGFPVSWFSVYIGTITLFICGTFWSEQEGVGELESIFGSLSGVLLIGSLMLESYYFAIIVSCLILVVLLWLEKRRFVKRQISSAYYRFRKVASGAAISSALVTLLNFSGDY